MALIKQVAYEGDNSVSSHGGNVRLDEGAGRLVAFDGQNNVGLFGFDSAGRVVVKVAKPGFDAASAEDDELIFNSQQNVLKVIDTDTLTLPGFNLGSNDFRAGTRKVAHGQSEIPIIKAYGRVNETIPDEGDQTTTTASANVYAYVPLPYNPLNVLFPDSVTAYRITVMVDETYIYFSYLYYTNALGGYNFPDVPIRYYILQESAN